jgi:hypothetical protein
MASLYWALIPAATVHWNSEYGFSDSVFRESYPSIWLFALNVASPYPMLQVIHALSMRMVSGKEQPVLTRSGSVSVRQRGRVLKKTNRWPIPEAPSCATGDGGILLFSNARIEWSGPARNVCATVEAIDDIDHVSKDRQMKTEDGV